MRRTSELIADSRAGQARVPHAARRILKDALALRAQRDPDTIDADEFGLRVQELKARTNELLERNPAARYRIVAYELDRDRETVVMDTTGLGSSPPSARSRTAR